MRPTPTFARPSARSSAFASISSPSPVAEGPSQSARCRRRRRSRFRLPAGSAPPRRRAPRAADPSQATRRGSCRRRQFPCVCNDSATTPTVAREHRNQRARHTWCPTPEPQQQKQDRRCQCHRGPMALRRCRGRTIEPDRRTRRPTPGAPVIFPSWLAIIRIAMPVM